MAGKGRPRTPTPILAAKGSWRAKQRLKTEPKAPPVTVDMVPKEVSRKGRVYWMKFAPVLATMGILDAAAVFPLVNLCKQCVDLDTAEKACDTIGAVMEDGAEYDAEGKQTKPGKLVESPWARIRDRLRKDVDSSMQKFGMQPSSRSSVEVTMMGFGAPVQTPAHVSENKRPLGI